MRHWPLAMALISALVASCAGPDDPETPSSSATDEPTAASAIPETSPSAAVTPREVSSSCRDGAGETLPTGPTLDPEATSDMSLADLLTSDPRFELFCAIASQAVSPGLGLSSLEIWDWPASMMGDNEEGVTLFVPTDDAFATLDPLILASLEEGSVPNDVLISLLGHHYIHWLYPSAEFEPGPQPTRSSRSTEVRLSLDPLTFGGCNVVETDIRVENGYVHVIDCVVVPQELSEAIAP